MASNSESSTVLKLNKIAFALAFGAAMGVIGFVLTLWAMLLSGEKAQALGAVLSSVMPGYGVSFFGCLVCFVYGLIFGALFGFLFAFFYNETARYLYYREAWKGTPWASKIDDAMNPDVEIDQREL